MYIEKANIGFLSMSPTSDIILRIFKISPAAVVSRALLWRTTPSDIPTFCIVDMAALWRQITEVWMMTLTNTAF